MSDLANSCEYLTIEKSCSAIYESEKAKANRQLHCENEDKMACCYLCLSRQECTIRCNYLGQIKGDIPIQVETEKIIQENNNKNLNEKEANLVTYCSLCNIEMSQGKTIFNIENWKGPNPKSNSDPNLLPVTIYLCPKCGKIEFKLEQKENYQ